MWYVGVPVALHISARRRVLPLWYPPTTTMTATFRANSAAADWRCTVEDTLAAGDKVMVRYLCSGTHTGEWNGLPPTGKEKYHQHALLRIYQDGLLVPVPKDVGIDLKRKVIAAIHTHDATGVLHFESDTPFRHTLGDVFEIWGLTFGPGQVGTLKDGDGRTVRVYVNGKQVADPAAYRVRKNDVIVIRYDDGSQNVPLNPDTTALKDANAGKGLCGASTGKKKAKSCTLMTQS